MEFMKLFKNTAVFCFLLLFCLNSAQKYRVFYTMDYRIDSTSSEMLKKNMILDVNNQMSKFYSYTIHQSDSTSISNEKLGKKTFSKSVDYDFMAIKIIETQQVKKIYRILNDLFEIDEKLPKFNWKISEETKMIDNLKCQKATLFYKGRNWIAWFSLEIPFNEGPYVFNGLPGLIVLMQDNKSNYNFTMVGLKKDYDAKYTNPINALKTIKVDKTQLDKLFIDYYYDPYKEVKAGKVKMNFKNEKGEKVEPNFNEITQYKQSLIKTFNNPIELSEIIKYPN